MKKKFKTGILASAVMLGSVALIAPVASAAVSDKSGIEVEHQKKSNFKTESLFDNHITKHFKVKTAQVGEHAISYEMYKGKGKVDKTYVLVHGAAGTGEFMKVIATELVEKDPKSRVVIVDLPLHGDSTGPMDNIEDINIHDYVDVMNDFLNQKVQDKTIQGKVSYIGWSMGGSIGLLLDLKGAPIDELTLLNSAPVWNEIVPLLPILTIDTIKPVFTSIVEADLAANISDKDRAEVLNHMDTLGTGSSAIMVQDFKAIVPEFYDVREELDKIKAKTLIISSTNDTVSNVGVQELMDDEIEESKLIVYEGETHTQLVKKNQAQKIVNEMIKYYK